MGRVQADAAADGTPRGNVFDIQHFSIHDGPGIRSTVFFQGCPLRCVWCHNPEGLMGAPFVAFDARKCARCGACARACPFGCHRSDAGERRFERWRCRVCGACVSACPAGALAVVGGYVSAREVADRVCRDRRYFEESGGGVTLSGGEPALQPAFLAGLLRLFGEAGIHRVVETCGYADQRVYGEILPLTELFLFDCKETDPARHRRLTGAENGPILENLFFLHDAGADILLRCPIIPGVNDREDHFAGIARIARRLPRLRGVQLLPYHKLGVSKADRMGLPAQPEFCAPSQEEQAAWRRRLSSAGVRVVEQ